MLSDSKREIKQASDSVLSEFLNEIRKVAQQGDRLACTVTAIFPVV